MARLKATLETLDDVPEVLREYYVERDGAFHLDAEELGEKGRRAIEAEPKYAHQC